MSEKLQCPSCSARFNFKPEMLGKKVRCSECKRIFVADQSYVQESASRPPVSEAVAERDEYDFADLPSEPTPAADAPVRYAPQAAAQAKEPFGKGAKPLHGYLMSGGMVIGMFAVLALIAPLLGMELKFLRGLGASTQRSVAVISLAAALVAVGIGAALHAKDRART